MTEPNPFELLELATPYALNAISDSERAAIDRQLAAAPTTVAEAFGDEVRAIDWNVTARIGHPFVKRFIEERELTVLLVVDCSGSQQFGTRIQQKREVAAELAAVLQATQRIDLRPLRNRAGRHRRGGIDLIDLSSSPLPERIHQVPEPGVGHAAAIGDRLSPCRGGDGLGSHG